ncbi:MAG TPA: flagellar type III secretion system protein FlhB [Geminicoccaceae bacterium]|nr:flagellar type III secretion system protein FlhB [Geminicoccaceae bacterium]
MEPESDTTQERSLEPTAHKLEQARRRGEVPQSRDVATFGLYVGLLVALAGYGGAVALDVGAALLPFLEQPDQLLALRMPGELIALVAGTSIDVIAGIAPLLLLPALGVALALAAQQAFTFTGERLQPKWSRLSPLVNARQRFGPRGLVEFAKTLLKLVAVTAVVGLVVWSGIDGIVGLARSDARVLGPSLLESTQRILLPLLALTAVIAAADYAWQRFDFMKRQRMTPQELKEEQKHTDVDPHLKQSRRERAVAIATNRMLRDVPAADVVITNPTHFAVALRWDRARLGSAPHCVAKGADMIARRIKEIASEHGVVTFEDRGLARSLYDLVEIGEEIRVEHYRAVAAALNYAARQRVRRTRGAGLP